MAREIIRPILSPTIYRREGQIPPLTSCLTEKCHKGVRTSTDIPKFQKIEESVQNGRWSESYSHMITSSTTYSWLYNFSFFCSSGTFFNCMHTSTKKALMYLQCIANLHRSAIDGPQTQFNHGFWCFTRLRQPQDEQSICSYGTCVFQPCICIGWVL